MFDIPIGKQLSDSEFSERKNFCRIEFGEVFSSEDFPDSGNILVWENPIPNKDNFRLEFWNRRGNIWTLRFVHDYD